MISLWLFTISIGGYMTYKDAKVGNSGERVRVRNVEMSMVDTYLQIIQLMLIDYSHKLK